MSELKDNQSALNALDKRKFRLGPRVGEPQNGVPTNVWESWIVLLWRRFVLALICTGCCLSNAQTVTTLLQSAPTDRRINIVVISEGYTQNELEEFEGEATAFVDHIFSEDPFLTYKSYFNAYALSIPSNQSGADEPNKNIEVDTAFDATFDSFGIERLLTVNSVKVSNALLEHFPEYDIVLVLVNSERYGGSGGLIAVSSSNSSSFEIAVHEIGHIFAGLTDEYETPEATPREAPNATQQTNRTSIKWKNWIDSDTPIPTNESSAYSQKVGLFEGATYRSTDWYRPHLNSKMRTLDRGWGQVNSEAIILSIYNRLDLFTTTSPQENIVQITTIDPIIFEALSPLPEDAGSLEYNWYIDGRQLRSNGSQLTLSPLNLTQGGHLLELKARDRTTMVRTDEANLLSKTKSWQIDVNFDSQDLLSFSDWVNFWILDPEKGGASLDSDLDGLSNLEEFYLGFDPMAPNSKPTTYSYGFENEKLFLRITRLPSSRLVSAYVETSARLGNWETLAESINGSPFTPLDNASVDRVLDGEYEIITIWDERAVDSSGAKRYLRVRIVSGSSN